jgi:hypothetical protein
MVDIAQVHATLVAALTWLVLASSTCVLRDAPTAGAAFPAPLGRQFNPSACSPRRKDARISVTLCDNAYELTGVFIYSSVIYFIRISRVLPSLRRSASLSRFVLGGL